MNRIILIGNGFDLAHGLKTSYKDFIHWYWGQWGEKLRTSSKSKEEDEFCSFELNNLSEIKMWYLIWSQYYRRSNPFEPWDNNEVADLAKKTKDYCDFKYKSKFFKRINQSIDNIGWVDIENEYYQLLTQGALIGDPKVNISDLNQELYSLKNKLVDYLQTEENRNINLIETIHEKIYGPIELKEIAVSNSNSTFFNVNLEQVLLLNFNYTNTPEKYLKGNAKINYIHGNLSNPDSVIFGYGDELDENYKNIVNKNDNEYLRNIKSVKYLEQANYRHLLEFIESSPFQIFIMGHSCGNSDRTLLNTLFEHKNCVSIKPFYYIREYGSDNYIELVQNISRNFTDMKLMRDRVVNKTFCEPLINTRDISD